MDMNTCDDAPGLRGFCRRRLVTGGKAKQSERPSRAREQHMTTKTAAVLKGAIILSRSANAVRSASDQKCSSKDILSALLVADLRQ
ncbi:hypothetical protein HCU64_15475 [Methylobacterium sp. C25]|uniref:hypothetical protein n=1 Tax=Methylobacterium sp. C25 TaxID=2721622 RepID=UPI001F1CDAC0|nr:hypothetical protein [Methylobacterium sp. C25]MCE4225156.1 hypothetical protein [Methylobacterium sp. C25]